MPSSQKQYILSALILSAVYGLGMALPWIEKPRFATALITGFCFPLYWGFYASRSHPPKHYAWMICCAVGVLMGAYLYFFPQLTPFYSQISGGFRKWTMIGAIMLIFPSGWIVGSFIGSWIRQMKEKASRSLDRNTGN
jgi:hypothetical protein